MSNAEICFRSNSINSIYSGTKYGALSETLDRENLVARKLKPRNAHVWIDSYPDFSRRMLGLGRDSCPGNGLTSPGHAGGSGQRVSLSRAIAASGRIPGPQAALTLESEITGPWHWHDGRLTSNSSQFGGLGAGAGPAAYVGHDQSRSVTTRLGCHRDNNGPSLGPTVAKHGPPGRPDPGSQLRLRLKPATSSVSKIQLELSYPAIISASTAPRTPS